MKKIIFLVLLVAGVASALPEWAPHRLALIEIADKQEALAYYNSIPAGENGKPCAWIVADRFHSDQDWVGMTNFVNDCEFNIFEQEIKALYHLGLTQQATQKAVQVLTNPPEDPNPREIFGPYRINMYRRTARDFVKYSGRPKQQRVNALAQAFVLPHPYGELQDGFCLAFDRYRRCSHCKATNFSYKEILKFQYQNPPDLVTKYQVTWWTSRITATVDAYTKFTPSLLVDPAEFPELAELEARVFRLQSLIYRSAKRKRVHHKSFYQGQITLAIDAFRDGDDASAMAFIEKAEARLKAKGKWSE